MPDDATSWQWAMEDRISDLEGRLDAAQMDVIRANLDEPEEGRDRGEGKFAADPLEWQAEDKLVAVDSAALPGFLGDDSTNGVLRTDTSIIYADGGDYITLSVNLSAALDGLPGDTGDTGSIGIKGSSGWELLTPPDTFCFLAHDPTNGVYWATGFDAKYKVAQRAGTDTMGGDWPRVNTAAP